MKYDEIIATVQQLTGLPDRAAAARATAAVLQTLGERLPAGLATHVAAQLPPELATPVREAAHQAEEHGLAHASGERFSLAVFAGRVAARAGTSDDGGILESAAVLEVLDAALAPELMDKIAAVLPHDIAELLPSRRAASAD
ncbi:DUF2267 domain-containing protein [Kitasatospora sp. CM 4170]|uniref:DUF2267 domain-containing protein n=1 Tax=Kitasatospora aburaviensis TaxID=67265 RepID=A0ABW1ETT0_9ACTN|nr:DUF2267 domain-containing protein [Kitasatospora sp. CM 4170]WNM43979.1 DUF2267 domain-containing protein [Kitasatospora sp. CM 4170]